MARSDAQLEVEAKRQGITLPRLKGVLAARRAYRDGRMYRNRSRARSLERNPKARAYKGQPKRYAGEGELHALLCEAGLSELEFCAGLAGIGHTTFRRWYGHPMHMMPVELLRHFIWAKNMAEFLQARGWDPEKFKARGVPEAKNGKYARNAEQHAQLYEKPNEILCQVHGRQKAMGSECPKC